jgi:hypothetical protein
MTPYVVDEIVEYYAIVLFCLWQFRSFSCKVDSVSFYIISRRLLLLTYLNASQRLAWVIGLFIRNISCLEHSFIAIEKKAGSTRLIISSKSIIHDQCLKNSKIGTVLSKFGMRKQFNCIIIEDPCYY